MFADDTKLHFSHKDFLFVEQILQADIQNVSVWLVANKLKLNVVKSLRMLIGSHQRISGKSLNLFLNDSALKQVSVMKYLGVYFDQHLTWDCHVNYVLKRVRRKLYNIMINCLRPVTPKVLQLLHQAFVLPIFDYCDAVWSPSNVCCIRRLERIHSRFLSLLPFSNASDLNMTLAECRTYHTAIQVLKILHNFSPTYLQGLFSYTNVTGHIGRNPHRLYVPGIRTNYGKRSLRCRGTVIWNCLPAALYDATTVRQFKSVFCTL